MRSSKTPLLLPQERQDPAERSPGGVFHVLMLLLVVLWLLGLVVAMLWPLIAPSTPTG